MNEELKITFISDTHDKHKQVKLDGGDILIHGGDVTNRGDKYSVDNFLNWLDEQPYRFKIFVAGNHDFWFEDKTQEEVQEYICGEFGNDCGIIYLYDKYVNIYGLNIHGSPIQPEFCNWAFNRNRGSDIKYHWDLIDNNTDILITHGPPFEVLDKTRDGKEVGCIDLIEKVNEVKPIIHVFGHIHEGYGYKEKNNIMFLNASIVDRYNIVKNNSINILLNSKTKEIKFAEQNENI